jgi:plastocyanin
MRLPVTLRAGVLLVAAAVGLGGCVPGSGVQPSGGGDTAADPAAFDGRIAVVGTDDLRWDVEELTVGAGTIEVALTCEDRVNHNLTFEGSRVEIVVCRPGETRTGVVELEPGEYTYLCTVPGHEATMRGTLTVTG